MGFIGLFRKFSNNLQKATLNPDRNRKPEYRGPDPWNRVLGCFGGIVHIPGTKVSSHKQYDLAYKLLRSSGVPPVLELQYTKAAEEAPHLTCVGVCGEEGRGLGGVGCPACSSCGSNYRPGTVV